jgi:spermidine/putrescine ABC transporter ATP-binding subunit
VSKAFSGTAAVDDLSLDVREEEFVSLLGPSGCGKTTTLRMIAGLEEPSDGIIKIGGEVVNAVASYRRGVGLVFQNWALFPHKTALDNVAFGLKMRGVRREERRRRAEEYLELVHLPGYGKRMPREMSGGEQQRVALARALIVEPRVLLLDEPLSNLDLRLRQQLRAEIREIQRKLAFTAIFVTHDQTEALSMSDRVAVMNRGRIEQVGTPMEVYEHPQTKFVAEFIGETNLIQGTIVSLNGEVTRIRTAGGLTLLAGSVPSGRLELKESSRVVVVIRPDHLRVLRGADRDLGNVVRGTVYLRAYLGGQIRYYLQLSEYERLFVDDAVGRGMAEYEIGDEVRVGWRPEECFCFDADRHP